MKLRGKDTGYWFVLTGITALYLGVIALIIRADIPRSILVRHLEGGEYIEYLHEGRSSTVWISHDRHGLRKVWINNLWISSTSKEVAHELLAHYPILFHGSTHKVAGIGFGSGRTFGACLLYPVESMVSVEIDEGVITAVKGRFSEENFGIFGDPRNSLIIDDGRFFLGGTKEKFDIITMEPSQPFLSGMVNLYSREFYEMCRNALNPGGIAAQWIPLDMCGYEGTWSMIRTFAEAFESVLLFQNGDDAILLGSDSEMVINPSHPIPGRAIMNMAATGYGDIYALAGNFVCSRDILRRASVSFPVITDDMPITEFTAPFVHGKGNVSLRIRHQLHDFRESVDVLFRNPADLDRAHLFSSSRTLIDEGLIEEQEGNIDSARNVFLKAYCENPEDTIAVHLLFMFLRRHNRLYELPEELHYLLEPLRKQR